MSNTQTLSSQSLPRGFTGDIEFRPENHIRLYVSSDSRLDQLNRLHRTGKPFNIFALGFRFTSKVVITYLQPFSLDIRFLGYVDLILLSPLKRAV